MNSKKAQTEVPASLLLPIAVAGMVLVALIVYILVISTGSVGNSVPIKAELESIELAYLGLQFLKTEVNGMMMAELIADSPNNEAIKKVADEIFGKDAWSIKAGNTKYGKEGIVTGGSLQFECERHSKDNKAAIEQFTIPNKKKEKILIEVCKIN